MWTRRLLITTFFHGLLAMGSAYFLLVLNSIDRYVKHFANESLSARFDTVLNEQQIGG
jgi:hypothetical protein